MAIWEAGRTHGDVVGRQWKLQNGQKRVFHMVPTKPEQGALDAVVGNKQGIGVLTENCSGRIITGETGLAHTRTVNCQLVSII
jgi:hypothetical protein